MQIISHLYYNHSKTIGRMLSIKELFKEDDAVSPVIGVILMVAITVILAAVIASFVLGLGDTADEVQPTTSFSFDYENNSDSNDYLTVGVADGDSISTESLYIRGDLNGNVSVDATFKALNDSASAELDGGWNTTMTSDGDEITAGQELEIEAPSNNSLAPYDIDVVWDTGDDSSTLDEDTGPEA